MESKIREFDGALGIRVSKHDKRILRELARATGTTVNDIVRLAIFQLLQRKGPAEESP